MVGGGPGQWPGRGPIGPKARGPRRRSLLAWSTVLSAEELGERDAIGGRPEEGLPAPNLHCHVKALGRECQLQQVDDQQKHQCQRDDTNDNET